MSSDSPADSSDSSPDAATVLQRLQSVIEARLADRPAGSYVAELAEGGHAAISSKLIEESYEVIAAAAEREITGVGPVISETADLWFHSLVMLSMSGGRIESVLDELANRFGIGGLDEKAARRDAP